MCQRYIQVEFELIYASMIFNRVMRLELKKKKLRHFQGFITYSTIKYMLYYILHLKFWSCAGANYAILKVSGFFFGFFNLQFRSLRGLDPPTGGLCMDGSIQTASETTLNPWIRLSDLRLGQVFSCLFGILIFTSDSSHRPAPFLFHNIT